MDFYSLLDKLEGYLPHIEIKDFIIKGELEPCMRLEDARRLCNAIINAYKGGLEPELFAILIPGALKTLSQLDQIEKIRPNN